MRVKANRGYLVCVADGSGFYMPNAEHIERDDSMMIYENDAQAALAAERDGVKLIYGMRGVPDGVYIDTKKNRAAIILVLNSFPRYYYKG